MPSSDPLLHLAQRGIGAPAPQFQSVQQFVVRPAVDIGELRSALAAVVAIGDAPSGPDWVLVAFGPSLLGTLHPDAVPPGTRPFTGTIGALGQIVATRDDLLIWCGAGTDSGCAATAEAVERLLGSTCTVRSRLGGASVGGATLGTAAAGSPNVVISEASWTGTTQLVAAWWNDVGHHPPAIPADDPERWVRGFDWTDGGRIGRFVGACSAGADDGNELVDQSVRGANEPGGPWSRPPASCGFYVVPGIASLEHICGSR